MTTPLSRVLSVALLGVACDYTPPLDPGAPAVLNGIAGTVVLGADVPTDDVLVLLYDAADPPPPAGLGRPFTFATVPASAFTGDGVGMQGAPFTLTEVPDGTWLVTAVMDVDDDFFPLLDSNAGPTCGDWRGAHLADLATLDVAPVTVAGGERLEGVSVLLAEEYTTERPAFEFSDNSVEMGFLLEPELELARLSELAFSLESVAIDSDLLRLAGPDEATADCLTGFLVLVEPDAAGAPAPHWEYGALEVPEGNTAAQFLQNNAYAVWPRVLAVYTGEGDVALAPGEAYVSEAIHDPAKVAGEWPVGAPFPVSSLDLTFVPGVQHILPDGSVELLLDPREVPQGEWAVTVVSVTGQSWTVPNETAVFPVTSDDFDSGAQGARLTVGL